MNERAASLNRNFIHFTDTLHVEKNWLKNRKNN